MLFLQKVLRVIVIKRRAYFVYGVQVVGGQRIYAYKAGRKWVRIYHNLSCSSWSPAGLRAQRYSGTGFISWARWVPSTDSGIPYCSNNVAWPTSDPKDLQGTLKSENLTYTFFVVVETQLYFGKARITTIFLDTCGKLSLVELGISVDHVM